ncbi:hypothetical protein [Nocardia crassostreae]|uniref:hypothetical protein n=1 Tax=Nocardia crassostreae TaxID=53428 RepID=UPI00082C84EC|nr:hypothetical protein [Nocardia crassostreae]
MLAADGDLLLRTRTEFSFLTHSFRSEVSLLGSDGAAQTFGELPEVDSLVHGAAFSPDGAAAVVIADAEPYGYVHPYGCYRAAVTAVDLRPGTLRTTYPVTENCTTPRKVRWDSDSGPTLVVAQRERDEPTGNERSYRWQYADDQWSPVDGPVVDRAETVNRAVVELAEPSDKHAHTLYRVAANGVRTQLAAGVYAMAVPGRDRSSG